MNILCHAILQCTRTRVTRAQARHTRKVSTHIRLLRQQCAGLYATSNHVYACMQQNARDGKDVGAVLEVLAAGRVVWALDAQQGCDVDADPRSQRLSRNVVAAHKGQREGE